MIFYEVKSNDIHFWDGSNMTFPPHIHKELELLVVTNGEMEATIDAKPYILRQGDICLAFPNTIHSYSTAQHCDYFLGIFNGNILPLYQNIFSSYRPSRHCISRDLILPEVYDFLRCIRKETQFHDNTAMITGYLYLIVGRLMPLLELKEYHKNDTKNTIEHILRYIQLNYLNPIHLSSMSNALNISPFAISRIFSNNIGIRLDQYINELRVNYANHLLSTTQKQVTEIAFECGFETLRTFNRVYKKITAMTPREYRRNQR